MTIDEAIKQITTWQIGKGNPSYDELNKALKLGLEALKRVKSQYDPDHQMMRIPLLGETRE